MSAMQVVFLVDISSGFPEIAIPNLPWDPIFLHTDHMPKVLPPLLLNDICNHGLVRLDYLVCDVISPVYIQNPMKAIAFEGKNLLLST